MTPDPTRSPRDIVRRAEQLADEPDDRDQEVDAADIWEAALEDTHPREMDTLAEEKALRKTWAALISHIEGTEFGPEDLEQASPDEIAKFDEALRRGGDADSEQ